MQRIILAACAILISIPQVGHPQLLRSYGFKGALSSSTHSISYSYGPELPPSKRRVGFDLGIYAEWLNVPFFSIITQIDYAQRGYQQGYYLSSANPSTLTLGYANDRIDYLSIPILMKLRLSDLQPEPYILFGPRLDFKLSYHQTFVYDYPTAPPYSDFKPTVFGATVGAGLRVSRVLPVPILLEFTYNSDFTKSFQPGNMTLSNNAYDLWIGVEL